MRQMRVKGRALRYASGCAIEASRFAPSIAPRPRLVERHLGDARRAAIGHCRPYVFVART